MRQKMGSQHSTDSITVTDDREKLSFNERLSVFGTAAVFGLWFLAFMVGMFYEFGEKDISIAFRIGYMLFTLWLGCLSLAFVGIGMQRNWGTQLSSLLLGLLLFALQINVIRWLILSVAETSLSVAGSLAAAI